MATLETLAFDNLVLSSLPIDSNQQNYVRQVAGACFSKVTPTPVEAPQLVAYSAEAMGLLDLPESELQRPEFVKFFSGNEILPGSETAAHCYCGHQFGYFSGQLGDGAAIYLGEVVNKKGERWEVQLKGAGKTPFSRQADGRKVLRSSIREFLCSEAMHYLGIPTTRAGACITSSTYVVRDIFYNGNPINERASVVTRIAPTFLRFGSFEIFKTQDERSGRFGPSVGRQEILKQMLDYSISAYYPEIHQKFENDPPSVKYRDFYREVVSRTAALVAEWQCVGFCHGVLNTDNMSIVGVTIDYGPYGFLDRYNPNHICNASDEGGRYTYANQPEMCKWNLEKFAEALVPELSLEEALDELRNYDTTYKECYLSKMRKKLGLLNKTLPEDEKLIENFLATMEATGADFSNCFRSLSRLSLPNNSDHEASLQAFLQYLLSQSASLEEMTTIMGTGMDENQFKFLVVLMNTQPEILECLGKEISSIKRELERRKKLEELKTMDENTKQKDNELQWKNWLKNYTERLKLEIDGLSNTEVFDKERKSIMDSCNPSIVLRNYIAQNAITKAEEGDFSEVKHLLSILRDPYSEIDESSLPTSQPVDKSAQSAGPSRNKSVNETKIPYTCRPPGWASTLKVS